jgi:hypothetical protein
VFISIVSLIKLIEFEVNNIDISNCNKGFDGLASTYYPSSHFSLFIKSCKNSIYFTPNQVVVLGLHSQKVDGVPVRNGDHVYAVKVL